MRTEKGGNNFHYGNSSRARKVNQCAMRVMGYTFVAQKGWVVKKYSDGSFEKIKNLASQKKNIKFILD